MISLLAVVVVRRRGGTSVADLEIEKGGFKEIVARKARRKFLNLENF